MIQAVGFDLGETLIHYVGRPLSWESLYRQALTGVAETFHANVTNEDIQRAEQILAHYNTRPHPRLEEVTSETVLGDVLAAWGIPTRSGMPQAEDVFFGFFRQTYAVYPDTLPALERLRDCGLRVGVLTDVAYGMPRRFIEKDMVPLAEFVDVVLTSADVGVRKPHPDGFSALARALDTWPDRMAYIGNEEKDIVGANAAGIVSVFLDREASHSRFGQHATVASLEELPNLLVSAGEAL